jgi:hypothetical protein
MEKTKISIKKKIINISNELRLTKDGENKFANYSYFKPDDILQALNPLLEKYNLFMSFNLPFNNDKKMYEAVLYFEDLDDEAQNISYKFDIPLTSVKGASEAQGAGATMTYAKRYSIMNVFSIADNNDDLDAKNPTSLTQKRNIEPIRAINSDKKEDFSADNKCSKCGGPTYYREGTSKKGNRYKGYKCANKQCDNFDFINEQSIEAKLKEAHTQADLELLKAENQDLPVISDDAEYGI